MTTPVIIGDCTLHFGDCLEVMPSLSPVAGIIADLPYGTTEANWDKPIPTGRLWPEYERLLIPGGAIVLTASQPFTSLLVCSKLDWFRTEWIWDKKNPTNFANAKKHPMKVHESVLVFGPRATIYNPQKVPGEKNHVRGNAANNNCETRNEIGWHGQDDLSGLKYPKSIQIFPKHSSQCGLHPTQKPVELMEYLVRTYSNPGDVILDNCMGSGTTGVACLRTGRKFIGIENDPVHFATAESRLRSEKPQLAAAA
jgi:site-specific DNA-methyltransferase (adenine-specific)